MRQTVMVVHLVWFVAIMAICLYYDGCNKVALQAVSCLVVGLCTAGLVLRARMCQSQVSH